MSTADSHTGIGNWMSLMVADVWCTGLPPPEVLQSNIRTTKRWDPTVCCIDHGPIEPPIRHPITNTHTVRLVVCCESMAPGHGAYLSVCT